MIALDFTFSAELWEWAAETGSWHFLTLPQDMSEDIKAFASESRRGFGSVRVRVEIGDTAWTTSIFPSKERGAFILPVKAAVRKAEGLAKGDKANVRIEIDP